MASSPGSSPPGESNSNNSSSSSSPPSKSPSSGGNSPPSSSSSPPQSKSPPSSPPPSSPPPSPSKSESPPPPDSNSSSPPEGNSSPPAEGNASSPPTEKSPSPPAANTSPPATTTPAAPGVFSPPAPVGNAALSPPDSSRSSSDGPSRESPSHNSPSSDSSSRSSHSYNKSSSSDATAIIVGVVVGSVIVLGILIFVCVVCTRKKKRKPYQMEAMHAPPNGVRREYYNKQQWNDPQDHVVKLPPPPNTGWGAPHSSEHSSNYSGSHQTPQPLHPHPSPMNLGFSKSQFTYEELASATSGFADANLLGQGGFGYVHKGVLPNGQEVAVKSLKTGSGQGEREFQAEVEIISRVHHRHLVSLVGYSIADTQRMLVYEFVPNRTLEFHLHDWKILCWKHHFFFLCLYVYILVYCLV